LTFVCFGLLVFVEVFVSVAFEAEITCFAQVLALEIEVLDATTAFDGSNRETFAVSEARN